MRTFFATLGAGYILVASFIFWADPAHLWHRYSVLPQRSIGHNEVWPFPSSGPASTQLIRIKLWEMGPRADVLLLGSSRVEHYHQSIFAPGIRFQNGGLSGGSIKNDVTLWQALKEKKKIPSHIIISIDPWLMNRNFYPQNAASSEYFERFTHTVPTPLKVVSQRLSQVKELVSLQQLLAAYAYFKQGRQLEIFDGNQIIDKSSYTKHGRGYFEDGSEFNEDESERVSTALERHRNILGNYLNHKNLFFNYELDTQYALLLRDLLRDMARSGVRVMLYLGPLHRELMNFENPDHPELEGFQREYADLVAEMKANESTKVSFCDMSSPARHGCPDSDFYDLTHIDASCSKKALRMCLRAAPGWRALAREDGWN